MAKKPISEFGERFRMVRETHGYNQTEFGRLLGIKTASVSTYERGLKKPSFQVIDKLIRTFDVSADFLFGLSKVMKPGWNHKDPTELLPAEARELLEGFYMMDHKERRALINMVQAITSERTTIEEEERKRRRASARKTKEADENTEQPKQQADIIPFTASSEEKSADTDSEKKGTVVRMSNTDIQAISAHLEKEVGGLSDEAREAITHIIIDVLNSMHNNNPTQQP